jgi:hypothetical protein
MLADVAQIDASLLQPCALLLREVLDPHWSYMSDSQSTPAAFRSALDSYASLLSSSHLTPFPITHYEQPVWQRDDRGQPPPKKAKVVDAPSDVYMKRLAAILDDQLALHCVELRVEGLIGQPCKTITCSPSDTVAHVLRSACGKFGIIAAADWRFYRDRGKREEVPLEETLDSCSISGYFTLYLG